MYFYIKNNLNNFKELLCGYAQSVHRDPATIKLLAVSKTFPADAVKAAYESGQRMFGENKVQELEAKHKLLPSDIEWHLIGHLQANKVAAAVEIASYIHSVDSEKLLNRINRIAGEIGKKQKILLEVNISGEESKFGLTAFDVESCTEIALKSEHIELKGLMTMAPFEMESKSIRKVFSDLRCLRDSLELKFNVSLPELSMGMSSDFKEAIAEGSTIVRIGTSIFGKR